MSELHDALKRCEKIAESARTMSAVFRGLDALPLQPPKIRAILGQNIQSVAKTITDDPRLYADNPVLAARALIRNTPFGGGSALQCRITSIITEQLLRSP